MITINKEKCIGCMTCISVCPFTALSEEKGKPYLKKPMSCLKCMHCAAACPQDAITYGEFLAVFQQGPMEISENFPAELKGHILRRRSYRHFSNEPVSRELIEEALELASWAPSAKNQHTTKWIVIDSRETIDKIMDYILSYAKSTGVSPEIVSEYAIGKNVVMGNASTLLLAYARDTAISPETDTAIAMATAELYLQSKGVGTCWAGYLKRMCNNVPEIKELLPQLPKGHSFYGAFMMGYPEGEEYIRIPERIKKADISWV